MPPPNDAFADAIALAPADGSRVFDNTGATYETGEPANIEGADGAASIWFRMDLPANGGYGYQVGFDTAATPENFDSTIELFTGTGLGDLVAFASADDIDYPTNVRSAIAPGYAADGQTIWIRIDGWASAGTLGPYTSDGVLTWTVVDQSPPPPAPTITGVAAAQVIGRDVAIAGTNLDSVTAVSFGGAAAAFSYDAVSGYITATVPLAARPDTVTVTNRGGAGSAAFQPLFPGPWRQPGDAWSDTPVPSTTNQGVQLWSAEWDGSVFDPDYPDASYDPSTWVSIGGGESGWDLDGNPSVDPLLPPEHWTLSLVTTARGSRIRETLTGAPATYMPAVPPAAGETAPADVYAFEYENADYDSGDTAHGAPLGPLQITLGSGAEIALEGEEVAVSTGTPADFAEISGAQVHAIRLEPADYTDDGIDLALPTWLTGARLRTLTELAAFPVAGDEATSTDGYTRPDINRSTCRNFTQLLATIDTIGLADLDDPTGVGELAVAFVTEFLLNDYYPQLPPFLDSDGIGANVGKRMTTVLFSELIALVFYRPPRYRLLYTHPTSVHVRQRQTGGAVRQRQMPGRLERQRQNWR